MFKPIERVSYVKKLEDEWKNSGSTDTFYDWLEKEYNKTEAWLKNLEEKEAELKRDDMKEFGQLVGIFLTTVSILAFICCLYTRVPYLLTAISLVTLFWGLWVMVYFRD